MISEEQVDAVFHLAGEQALPIYFGVLQFNCPLHLIGVTMRTREIGERIQRVLKERGLEIELVELDAYNLQENIQRIEGVLEGCSAKRWLFNLTGGTKPMFAGAYLVAQQRGIKSFYIETTNRTVDWLNKKGDQIALKPVANTVDAFIRLADYETETAPNSLSGMDAAVHSKLIRTIWKQRNKIGLWYRNVSIHNSYPGVPFKDGPRQFKGLKCMAELKGPDSQYEGTLVLGNLSVTHAPWPDLSRFVSGEWFESFVYQKVLELVASGQVQEAHKNLFAVTGVERSANKFQEFDVAMTDGYCLSIIECKAGDVHQEHVQKLENLKQRFGGPFGKGILVVAQADKLRTVKERVRKSRHICAVDAVSVEKNPAVLLTCQPGEIIVGQ